MVSGKQYPERKDEVADLHEQTPPKVFHQYSEQIICILNFYSTFWICILNYSTQ